MQGTYLENATIRLHFVLMDKDMDNVFKTLADPTLRRLLDRLHADDRQTLGRVVRARMETICRPVTGHLAVLQTANLVITIWRGREKLHYLNPRTN